MGEHLLRIVTVITVIVGHSHCASSNLTATITSLASILTQCNNSNDWPCVENALVPIWPLSTILKQPLPSCIRFYLYYWDYSISSTDYQSTEIIMGNASTIPPNFNSSADTKMCIHGWAQNVTGVMPASLVNAYMRNGTGANIMAMDWSCLATTLECYLASISGILIAAELPLNYFIAVANTKIVGKYLCQFILWLYSLNYLQLKNTHLIGHSLGAHISGIAGDCVMNSMPGSKIGRITGLDPAGPLFYSGCIGRPMSPPDAIFVDVIHTDAFCLGLPFPVGDVDFYPNGGRAMQPNCVTKIFADILSITPLQFLLATCNYAFEIFGCNHFKSVYYFIASITNNYPANPCPSAGIAITSGNLVCNPTISPKSSTVSMGEQCSPNANGSYYLNIATIN